MKGSEKQFRKSVVCGCGLDDTVDCECGGYFIVDEGYDIYHNEFNYSWECSECGRSISISGTTVKAQKLNKDTDTWEDIDIDTADDFYGEMDSVVDQVVTYDDELKSVVYELYGDDCTIRYIIEDVIFEDTKK